MGVHYFHVKPGTDGMAFRASLFAAAVLSIMVAPAAYAFPSRGVPTTTNPGALTSDGIGSSVIFAFASAADQSQLSLAGRSGYIFDNKTNSPGDKVDLGSLSGPQVFSLDNLTTMTSFPADLADAVGDFHAFYTTNFAEFSVGALPAAAAAAIATLPGSPSITFVGWEDLTAGQGSDWDYNDLIVAFSNLTTLPLLDPTSEPTSVVEPTSLVLLGSALAMLGSLRRRRKIS